MTRAGLTPSQGKLLAFIAGFIASHGYSPSFAEMRDGIGFASCGAVASLVKGLEERGHLFRLPRRHRSIALTKIRSSLARRSVSRETPAARGVPAHDVPIAGGIAADGTEAA